jgi:hypothetical protein
MNTKVKSTFSKYNLGNDYQLAQLCIKTPTSYSKEDDPEPMSESDEDEGFEESKITGSKFEGDTKPMSEIESEF